MPPPVTRHPSIEIGDLGGRAGHHDERVLARGLPVVEVVQAVGVAHLVQEDVDVLRVEVVEHVVDGQLLAPVAAEAAHLPVHALAQPQRDVVPARLALGAPAEVVVRVVHGAAAGGVALGDAVRVGGVGVDVQARRVALEQGGVVGRPSGDGHVHRLVGEAVEPGQGLGHPLVVLGAQHRLELLALLGGNSAGARVPADAVLDLGLGRHDVVIAQVLELGVVRGVLVPDLCEALDEVRRRIPYKRSAHCPPSATGNCDIKNLHVVLAVDEELAAATRPGDVAVGAPVGPAPVGATPVGAKPVGAPVGAPDCSPPGFPHQPP